MKPIIISVGALMFAIVSGQGPYVANKNVTRVPAYRFQPNQELVYQGHSTRTVGRGVLGTDQETALWVTGQNKDSSWHMVVRRTRVTYTIDSSGVRDENSPAIAWAMWDLHADGHANYNRTMEELDPNGLFIPMPENILAAGNGWSLTRRNYWERNTYSLDERSTDSLWIVKDSFLDPLVQVGRTTLTALVQIDPRQGRPVRKDETFIQQIAGSPVETPTATALESVRIKDSVWVKDLASDARIYFEADSVYNGLLEQALRKPKKTDDLLILAKITLRQARAKAGTREFQTQLDSEIAGFPDDSNYVRNEADQLALFIDRPARGWETEDFDGKPYALKDLRKKVIVMDFWYRGCPWCIMAMPQLNQLAEYFASRPVVILGMNVDKEDADARYVIDKMKLAYPNIKAVAIAHDYGIKGYPHLLIIDQKGVIRDVHIGYTPDLFDQVRKSVEALLKK